MYYGMSPDWPAEVLVTVTFAKHDGKTTLTPHHTIGSAPASERAQYRAGRSEALDPLATYLS
jgi:hypothetical protein